jgi:photosystem II stability/assembly factor-like uncharacterized protein
MDGCTLRLRVAIFLLLSLAPQSSRISAAENDSTLARSMLDDAELFAVTFVDREHGWAVGDRGVIWRSEDGGQAWQLERSGVTCSLRDVHFADAENGWAVGGEFRPYLRSTKGVLLRTRDGGRTWEADKGLLLPAVRKIKFFGGLLGWALAEPSAVFPSGVFFTDTGGQSWSPVANREISNWTIADFANPKTGALAGGRGARGAIADRALEPWQQPEFGLREPRSMRLVGPTEGWLAGDGGLLAVTHDGGHSWEQPDETPPTADQFDFRTIEARDAHVWVAGAPGTVVMHSADRGASWESQATGQNLPINSLSFVDIDHGWAVGALGTILATSDGGRTWQKQRGPRERAAVLAVYSDAERVPAEALARLAGNEGLITAVELLCRRDLEPDMLPGIWEADRERAALVALACNSAERAWGFPLRQKGVHQAVEQIIETWNRMYGGQGVERLEEHLVRRIRAWRPEVIVTSAASPGGDDPLGHLVNQVVLRAVTDAANPEKFSEQIARAGLAPWTVKKVAGSLPAGKLGTINVNTSQLAPRLARSLADYASPARGLLLDRYVAPPNAWGFRLYMDSIPQGLGQQDFLSGITLQPGSDARRDLPASGRQGLDAMRQIAEKHRNLQAILAHAERSERGGAILLGQIGDLTRGLDAETAGQALFELAQSYYADGQWDFAAATFTALAEKYPSHSLAAPSLTWLVQYWASGEAACRTRQATVSRQRGLPATRVEKKEALIPSTVPTATADRTIPRVALASAGHDVAAEPTALTARRARADEFARALERLDAQAWCDMHVQFPLAMTRERAAGRDLDRFFTTIASMRPHDAWRACARGEQWLAGPDRNEPPTAAAHARQGAAKPRLDGLLEEELWQQAERLELASALSDDAQWPATVMLAYDNDFIYLAIVCREAPLAQYTPENRTRMRDADLGRHDRVEVLLDVDRDWTTFYRLSVDYRGWTADECWGDTSWNPRWYVASTCSDENWTIEAAIPLAELSVERVGPKTVWAIGLQRILPDVGFQSWTRPASVAGAPEGCGYLIFD